MIGRRCPVPQAGRDGGKFGNTLLSTTLPGRGLWCGTGLILASLWYIGVHSIGIGKTGFVLGALLLGFLLPLSLFLDKACEFEMTRGFPPTVLTLAGLHWTLWLIIAGLVLLTYYCLTVVAVRIKRSSELYL